VPHYLASFATRRITPKTQAHCDGTSRETDPYQ
jgi:hypothetical protein